MFSLLTQNLVKFQHSYALPICCVRIYNIDIGKRCNTVYITAVSSPSISAPTCVAIINRQQTLNLQFNTCPPSQHPIVHLYKF